MTLVPAHEARLYDVQTFNDDFHDTFLLGALLHGAELEFLKNLWGLGKAQSRNRVIVYTGPPGYIGWRNSFPGVDSWAP